MGLDRPGITPTKKRKVRRKATTTDDERAASSRVTRQTSRPRKTQRPLVRVIPKGTPARAGVGARGSVKARKKDESIIDKAGDALRLVHGDQGGRVKGGPRVASSRGLLISPTAVAGSGRVLRHASNAVTKKIVTDPIDSTEKTVKQAGDIAKGVASAAIALPVYTVTHSTGKVLGLDPKGDSPAKIAKRMIDAEGKRLSKTYGPSYRNEKGAARKLEKQIDREGPLIAALDLATVAAPVSLGAGATLRGVNTVRTAKGKKPGAVGKLVNRKPVRITPLGAPTTRAPRRGLTGMAASATRDAARSGVQRAAVARSKRTGKPLPARRALLKPGEVTPISPLSGSKRIRIKTGGVNRKLRVQTARPIRRADATAARRVQRHVTDTSKHADSLRKSFKGLPESDHHAAITAGRLGIKDAAGARAIIPLHIAEIERTVKAARADPKHPDHAAASRDDAHLDELAKLRAYLKDPKVFDRADVQRAADAPGIRRPVVGPREGLGSDRGEGARAGLLGGTLGVKTAKEVNDAARVVRRQEQKVAKRAVVVTRDARVKAEADLRVARAKGDPAAVAAAEAALLAARATAKAARSQRAAVRTAPRVVKESGSAHAARVDAEAAKLGLVPPAHIRSEFKRADDELRVQRRFAGKGNKLNKERKGTLYRTGREEKTLGVIEGDVTAKLREGPRLEADSQIIAEHAKTFPSREAAQTWAKQHGLNTTEDGDMVIAEIPGGMARKGLVTPRTKKSGRPDPKSDAGDYVKTRDVMLIPKVVYREMIDQADFAAKPPNVVKQTLAQSQAALLALNPAWFQFQRVNDMIAATMGGSLQHTAVLEKARRQLRRDDPDAYERLAVMSGGSMSREMLTPHSAQTMGRYKKILDENPTYRDALRSSTPATALLLRAGKNLPTALLRSDQAITGSFRERQLLHELRKVARKMDPNVKAVNRAFDPIGQAFKTGDINAISKLLKDPAYQRQLADATERLEKIHGDWSTYTARELNTKQYAAFYGFLRYSTRMALFTLPLGHPTMGLLIARLGQMGAQDAKAIIGPDMPWGLGTLYNADGTIAADFIRANPITGPLLSINKPEQLVGLSTPLASIVLSTALGQSIGLSDSSAGYTDKHTVKGDPKDTAIGGFFSTERGRILGAQLMRMLGPVSEWQRFDERVQTDDSLPFDRRIATEPAGSEAAARLAIKNANRVGGMEGLAHNTLPLLFPGSSVNRKIQGQTVTAARTAAKQKETARKIRRIKGATPRGSAAAGGFFDPPASSGSGLFDEPASSGTGLFD